MILIIGRKEDPHVKAVSYGLDKLGSKYVVWYPADPCEEYFFHSHSESEWLIAGHRLDNFKVIWFRRIGKTIIPEGLAEGYREPWIRQAEDVQYTILHLLKRGRAIWVNDWERALRAENKFLQLEAALAAGFIVPETLLSNIPGKVMSFIDQAPDSTIYKPFERHQTPSGAYASTAVISNHRQISPASIAISRGQYQRLVKDSREIRLFVYGDNYAACEIAAKSESSIDKYRTAPSLLTVEETVVDGALIDASRKVLCHLGLVTGSFDILLTQHGEPCFLEVNQGGQFLWLEKKLPHLGLLESFCVYLAGLAGNSVNRAECETSISLKEFEATSRHQIVPSP